jgi:hypothetical protein
MRGCAGLNGLMRDSDHDIDQPIFVLGTGRCGSTIVFEALARHEDLGWFSNYNNWFPRFELASWMPRLYDLPLLGGLPRGEKRQHRQGRSHLNDLLPMPSECYPKWEVMCGRKFRDDFLLRQEAESAELLRVNRAVSRLLRLQGKKRFAAKVTGPPRIHFLASLFPDARFVHVIRDARAVVNSLLKVDYWKESGAYYRPKWENGLPEGWETEWEAHGATPAALAALQYRAILATAKRESSELEPEQYLEVAYEGFVADPLTVIHGIQRFCGLGESQRVDQYVTSPQRYKDMNRRGYDALSSSDLESVRRIIGAGTGEMRSVVQLIN